MSGRRAGVHQHQLQGDRHCEAQDRGMSRTLWLLTSRLAMGDFGFQSSMELWNVELGWNRWNCLGTDRVELIKPHNQI